MKNFLKILCILLTITSSATAKIADLDYGVISSYIHSYASRALVGEFDQEISEAFVDAYDAVRNYDGSKKDDESKHNNPKENSDNQLRFREPVKRELTRRIKEKLPQITRKILREQVFQNAIGNENIEQWQQFEEKIVAQLNTKWGDIADQTADKIYDSFINYRVNNLQNNLSSYDVDVRDFKATVESWVSSTRVDNYLGEVLADELGESTVSAMRNRIDSFMNDELPPEVSGYLNYGPEFLAEKRKELSEYFPGHQFQNLLNQTRINEAYQFIDELMMRSIIKIPTPAYAAVLSAFAAQHFAKAFSGITVDPNEIRRGLEVTRTMVWQIQNKKRLDVTLKDIMSFGSQFAEYMGCGDLWNNFNFDYRMPINRLTELTDELDSMINGQLDILGHEVQNVVAEIESELLGFQRELAKPMREFRDTMNDNVDFAGQRIAEQIPDEINGVPDSWYDLKNRTGLQYGDWAEHSPMDEIKKLDEKTGFSDSVNELIADGKEQLAVLNEKLSGKLGALATQALEYLNLLPTAHRWLVKEPKRSESVIKNAFDPVTLHNGEFIHFETDLCLPSFGKCISFRRSYRSLSPYVGPVGFGWRHSFEHELYKNENEVIYIDDENQMYRFNFDGFIIGSENKKTKLLSNEQGFVLFKDDNRYYFDKTGKVIRVLEGGTKVNFQYRKDLLAQISFGHSTLNFKYDKNQKLISVKDNIGRYVSYEYDEESKLIAVHRPKDLGQKKSVFYRYKNKLLTDILDESSDIKIKNHYDDKKRVVAQKTKEGLVKAVYGKNNTWVWDQNGKARVHKFDEKGRFLSRWLFKDNQYMLEEKAELNNKNEAKVKDNACYKVYENAKNTIKYEFKSGAVWTLVFKDAVVKEIAGDGRKLKINHNLRGFVDGITDSAGKFWSYPSEKKQNYSFPGLKSEFRGIVSSDKHDCFYWKGELKSEACSIEFLSNGFVVKVPSD